MNNIEKQSLNETETRLYDFLSHYKNIMDKAKKAYKPYTPRAVDEQAGRMYIAAYKARHGKPPVLYDWSCQVCCLKNWQAFASYYDEISKYKSKPKNGTTRKIRR